MPLDQLRNMLLIALALIGFMIWTTWQEDYGPKPLPPSQATAPTAETTPADVPSVPSTAAPAPAQPGAADVSVPTAPAAPAPGGVDVPQAPGSGQAAAPVAVAQGESVHITTDVLDVRIGLTGGDVQRVDLLQHAATAEDPSVPFTLMNDQPLDFYIVQSGLLGGAAAPTHQANFTVETRRYELAPGQDELRVTLRWQSDDGVSVEKHYLFKRNSYVIRLEHVINNASQASWEGRMYAQIQRNHVVSEGGLFQTYTYTGGVISNEEKPYEKIDFEDMASQALSQTNPGGWIAMIQHYFVGALIPAAEQQNHFFTNALPGGRYTLGVMTPPTQVAPGASEAVHVDLFVGPKDPDQLSQLAPNLERTVDYGWLWFIAEPLFYALRWIHGIVGNWGFAIIVLTIVIKALFFHLSAASYKSMARMRKLQPRIMALRDRYSNDKARMNQAMMDMYKEEKINPLGGCLPILVQIPVFIALYWVLLESVALRHAPFVFWLTDLSEKDPLYVLPLIMGASMFVQQKLNPAPPDPIQAKVMMALPIVFTLLFLQFPSGLVLYWIVNNLLSIAQQWVITRKIVGPDG